MNESSVKNHTDVLIVSQNEVPSFGYLCWSVANSSDGRRELEVRVAPSRKRSGMGIILKTRYDKRTMFPGVMLSVIMVIAICCILTRCGMAPVQKEKEVLQAEVAMGLEAAQKLENVKVADAEAAIAASEEESRRETNARLPLKERFSDAMILGDSQAAGLPDYGLLPASQIAATVGCSIEDSDIHIATAVEMNPSTVFFTYGLNDLERYENGTSFAGVYAEKINTLRAGLPDTKVFVTSIFPPSEAAIEKEPFLGKYWDFNEALQNMAMEMGITYIDCTAIVEEQYYRPDGQHFEPEFYEMWLRLLADRAGI